MSKDLYAREANEVSDGQGCLTSGLVSSKISFSRGPKRKALGGPIKRPGTRLASEYRGSSIERHCKQVCSSCGGLMVTGGHFARCAVCGLEDARRSRSKEIARQSGKDRKRFMKSMKEVIV